MAKRKTAKARPRQSSRTATRARARSKSTMRKPAARAARATKAPKTISPEEMMAQWQAAMTPGPGHARLEPLVGTWKATTTLTMAPGAPSESSEGTSEHRWVLGGRFVEQLYRGSAMGMPFEGLGYTGYDNASKRYIGTWMDSCGTGVMTSTGSGRPSDQLIRLDAVSGGCTGEPQHFDAILKIADRDHHSFEMWTKAPNGKRFRTMIVEYVRA